LNITKTMRNLQQLREKDFSIQEEKGE